MSRLPSVRRRVALGVAGAIAVCALVTGLVLFQPWLLFIDVRVNEQLPSVNPSESPSTQETEPDSTPTSDPVPAVLSSGTFVSQEHTTSGTATIVENPDGSRVLAIENLDTSNGPDVHVWLSAADAVEGVDGWFLAGGAPYYELGPIKGNQGNQVYDIPAEVDLGLYRSISLWCVQFNVGFGAAQLG